MRSRLLRGNVVSRFTTSGENAPLRLVRLGKTVATGRFGSLAGQHAMFVD